MNTKMEQVRRRGKTLEKFRVVFCILFLILAVGSFFNEYSLLMNIPILIVLCGDIVVIFILNKEIIEARKSLGTRQTITHENGGDKWIGLDFYEQTIINPELATLVKNISSVVYDIREIARYDNFRTMPESLRKFETITLQQLDSFLIGYIRIEKHCDETTIEEYTCKLKSILKQYQKIRDALVEKENILLDVKLGVLEQTSGVHDLELEIS